MVQLKELILPSCSLTSVELKGCNALEVLNLQQNALTELNLEEAPSILSIDVSMNTLGTLDCSPCRSLTKLLCNDNQLSSLNLEGCKQLEELDFSANKALQKVELREFSVLKGVTAYSTGLKELDLSGCEELQFVDTSFAPLERLKVRKCEMLKNINCYKNDLRSIDLSGCSALTSLSLQTNTHLFRLDVSDCINLQKLLCSSCGLTELILGEKPVLQELWCNNNKITELDLTQTHYLQELQCEDNELQKVAIPFNCSTLNFVALSRNQLSACELDDVCRALPDYSKVDRSAKMRVAGNPGASTYKSAIATDKGWQIDQLGDGTGCLDAVEEILSSDFFVITGSGIRWQKSSSLSMVRLFDIEGNILLCIKAGESLPTFTPLRRGTYLLSIDENSCLIII